MHNNCLGLIVGKRFHRDAERASHDGNPAAVRNHEMRPYKRVRGGESDGVLGAAWSTNRIRYNAAARTRKNKDKRPHAMACGVGGLATPNALEISHQAFLGPSFQQERTVIPAQGDMRVEKSVGGSAGQRISGAVQPEPGVNDMENGEEGCTPSRSRDVAK